MAKCSGCNKSFADNYLAYHRSKCKKSKTLLQRSLQIFNLRRQVPANRPAITPPEAPSRALVAERGAPQLEVEPGLHNEDFHREDVLVDSFPAGEDAPVGDDAPLEVQEPLEEEPLRTRSGRQRRIPKRHADFIPSSLREIPSHIRRVYEARMNKPSKAPSPSPSLSQDDNFNHVEVVEEERGFPDEPEPEPEFYNTEPNEYGVFRQYTTFPQADPEADKPIDACVDSPAFSQPEDKIDPCFCKALKCFGNKVAHGAADKLIAPFKNISIFRFMSWLYSGKTSKSLADCQILIDDVIGADDFERIHMKGFNIAAEFDKLDHYDPISETLTAEDGWREGIIHISVPMERCKFRSEAQAPTFAIKGLHYRPLLGVIKSAFEDPSAKNFHFVPHKCFWTPPASPPSKLSSTPAPFSHAQQPNSPNTHRNRSRKVTVEDVHEDEDNETSASRGSKTGQDDTGEEDGWVDDDEPPMRHEPKPERIFSEIFNCDTMLEEHKKINSQPREPDDPTTMEYVIAALINYSDGTRLANFGGASLWPAYQFFGNQTKYERGKPSCFSAHHFAYIPSLPDNFQDWYKATFGKPASAEVLRFCKVSLMQGIWLFLLDDDFMHAYVHGVVIRCGDGIVRRVFPRFLVYSADYPEKCLVACIRQLACCPCMRCYCEKAKIPSIGLKRDMRCRVMNIRVDTPALHRLIEATRGLIFGKGLGVRAARIKRLLDPKSLLPIRSAFSIRLAEHGFNHYAMFAPDFMHEFELGIWKAIFVHLLRLMVALGADSIQDFDRRFRKVATFGCDIIRRFQVNVSSQRRICARDYEDLLQCIIPVIEGIFPKRDNKIILDLLYTLAEWHSYAKLRLHTESTLEDFERVTTRLCDFLRKFKKTVCKRYVTKELPREINARGRRTARLAAQGKAPQARRAASAGARNVEFNMSTYKMHALPDYPLYIRALGTTDNYTTQMGELEHKRPKGFYLRTSRKNFVVQIAKHERRQRLLRRIGDRLRGVQLAQDSVTQKPVSQKPVSRKRRKITHATRGANSTTLKVSFTEAEPLSHSIIQEPYHISRDQRLHVDLTTLVTSNRRDLAYKDFYHNLEGHILSRLTNREYDGAKHDFTLSERSSLRIEDNRLYKHKVLRTHFTTYDMRRSTDSINPRVPDHANIIVQGYKGKFWYARIIGVFHVNARLASQENCERMDILWVRWYGEDTTWACGPTAMRLPRMGFIPHTEPAAFGFIDPRDVVRAAHMIPAFAHGRTDFYLPPSQAARAPCENDEDWTYYYVNIFVDRDMFMLHRGGGVGHRVVEIIDEEDEDNEENWEDVDDDDEEEEEEERGGDGEGEEGGETEVEEEEEEVEEEEEEVEEEEEEVDEEGEEGEEVESEDEDKLEDEILTYGYDPEDYDDEDEDEEEGFVEPEEENEGIEEIEERRGNLGPEDGEYEDDHDGYFGYAPL